MTRTALIVEDSEILQKVYRMALEDAGYSIDIAGTGLAALVLLDTKQFDVVLMDIGLPDKTGIEVTKIFRQSESWRHKKTPIIAISVYLNEEIKSNCIDAGCDLVLLKPIALEVLNTHLNSFRNTVAVE
jgi:CheY-like chemotaxis protein